MSLSAPWLPLSVDWMDSEMFDDATASTRLAWICLLCHVKAQGRAGRAKMRAKTFATRYGLSERAVEDMIQRAQKCAAVTIDGDSVTLTNWRVYQQRTWGANSKENQETGRTQENPATHHTSHTTEKSVGADAPTGGGERRDGGKPKRSAKKAKQKNPDSSSPFWEVFGAAWSTAHGKKYPWVGGRDNKAARELWETLGGDTRRFAALCRLYVASTDDYHARNGWPLWAMPSALPALLSLGSRAGDGEIPTVLPSESQIDAVFRESAA